MARSKVRHQLLALLAPAMVASVGCSPVGFEQTPEKTSSLGTPGGNGGSGGNTGTDDGELGTNTPQEQLVASACQNSNLQSMTKTVTFPRPQKVFNNSRCDWNNGGNGAPLNGYFQARLEQKETFSIPQGAKICDIQFASQTQTWRYDDHVFLTMDDVLLASSHPVHDKLTSQSGLANYDWSKIFHQTWEQIPSYVWCVGMDEGLSQCAWPASETEGEIKMDFAPQIFQKIMARDLNRTTHEFKFITSGDNDTGIDCDHSDLTFDVQIKYTY